MRTEDQPSIERAGNRDATEIADLYLASRAEALPYLRQVRTEDEVRRWIRDVVVGARETWVARLHGRIVGFLALHGDELDQLYVLPGYFRRGLGARLLDKAKERSPRGLHLFTFQRNEGARAFYEAHGFRIVDLNDGSRNEEGEPDVSYRWTPAARLAVTLPLGSRAADAIVAARASLDRSLLPHGDPDDGYSPHLTLAVVSSDAVEAAVLDATARVAATWRPIGVTLASIGIFPGPAPVLFLGAVATPPLLNRHAALVEACGTTHVHPHYRPGAWVPHVTLAQGAGDLGRALASLQRLGLPLLADLDTVEVVRLPPARVLVRLRLPR